MFFSSFKKFCCKLGANEERFQSRKEAVQEAVCHKNWNIYNESADIAFCVYGKGLEFQLEGLK